MDPMNRQLFSRTGNAPDLGALSAPIRTAVGDPFYLTAELKIGGVITIVVEKPTAWQPNEITVVQNAVNAAPDATPQTEAQNQIDQFPIKDRAVISALIKEINILRAAVVPALPPRTLTQAIGAVKNEAGNL
jgi:hypothetical protein